MILVNESALPDGSHISPCANRNGYQLPLHIGWVAGMICWFIVKSIIPFFCQDLE